MKIFAILLLIASFVPVTESMPVDKLANQTAQAASKDEAGLATGAAAPAFMARDQFGREQTNKTVAGKNGTVLLFFRSADW